MSANLSRNWVAGLSIAIALAILFATGSLFLYRRIEKGVIDRHIMDQRLLASVASDAISHRADTYRHDVDNFLGRFQSQPPNRWQRILEEAPLKPPTENLLLIYGSGTLYPRHPIEDRASVDAALLPWLGSEETVLTNPFPPEAARRSLVLLVPVRWQGELIAQVGFQFPLDWFQHELFPPAAPSAQVGVFLLDEQGTVLSHSEHPGMIGRRIPPKGEGCLPCHVDFAAERRVLQGKTSAVTLEIANESPLLVAFEPVAVPGRRWLLALTESHSAIIADTRRGFLAIILLLGLVLAVGLYGITASLRSRLERRRAEERAELAERRVAVERLLRQGQQLASIGKMTSQIAHQINTPLATLSLNVEYLQTEAERRLGNDGGPIAAVCAGLAQEIQRLKRVVNDYLRFSRLPEPELAVESLREVVEDLLDFCERETREQAIRLRAFLGADPVHARIDSELFRQAFLNLVRNSIEAMPDGGTLTLSLFRHEDEITLCLKDTGPGMPGGILSHIFEPFFTTKKDGTGLGLAYSKRLIELHGGSLKCRSQPGEGTEFTIHLPAAQPVEREPSTLAA